MTASETTKAILPTIYFFLLAKIPLESTFGKSNKETAMAKKNVAIKTAADGIPKNIFSKNNTIEATMPITPIPHVKNFVQINNQLF